jgi:ABC-type sugar transport system substrate-binding protein
VPRSADEAGDSSNLASALRAAAALHYCVNIIIDNPIDEFSPRCYRGFRLHERRVRLAELTTKDGIGRERMGMIAKRRRYLASILAIALAMSGLLVQRILPAAAQDKQIVIGASVPYLNDPAWVRIVDYAQYVAKILDINLIVVDAGGKEDKQINDVQSLLSRGVQALIFVPVSAANAPAIIRLADRAKVPAIATDRYPGFPADNPEAPYLTFVGPDNVTAGRKIAEFMIAHGVKHFVAIGGTPGDSNNQERSKGMREAIAAASGQGVKLLQYVGVLESEDNGYTTMQNLLSAHPSGTIDGVWCYNDALCVGAYRAIKQAGRDKEIKIGAMDLNPQALDLIAAKTNYIYSIGGHWLMLGFAEMIAYDYLHGHKPLSQFSRIEDVGVDASGFAKFKAEYIDSNPPIDIKQYMLTFNPNAKTQTPPLTLQ